MEAFCKTAKGYHLNNAISCRGKKKGVVMLLCPNCADLNWSVSYRDDAVVVTCRSMVVDTFMQAIPADTFVTAMTECLTTFTLPPWVCFLPTSEKNPIQG